MDKRRLSAIPRKEASPDMLELASRLGKMEHIVTAELVEDGGILLMGFYRARDLREGRTGAEFRTFLSRDDYITQDLRTEKIRWKTASFDNMECFSLHDHHWDDKKKGWVYEDTVLIRSDWEKKLISDFFEECGEKSYFADPWNRVYAFQESVRGKRLDERHKKETDAIDKAMAPIRDVPGEFIDWVWETGMGYSRYLIYWASGKSTAGCECTYCKASGTVDRSSVRLRNNERVKCPFCGSDVTAKAIGRMAAQKYDERWFAYIDPTEDGFVFRYFEATRVLRKVEYSDGSWTRDSISELCRAIYTFPNGKPKYTSYEWGVYKQRGNPRWCPDHGKYSCMECVLYPGNLPQAWGHTPMKYSGLEYLSTNAPGMLCRYEDAIEVYIKHPKLEWVCKMGLNNLAANLIKHKYQGYGHVGRVNLDADTIYRILGINKVDTRILQEIDGNTYHLRLLQVAESIGMQFKPGQLAEFYDTFECNTDLLKQAGRKVPLHKIMRYIDKESNGYPLESGEGQGCWMAAYGHEPSHEDPAVERKRNMASDWLEYLGWCKELKYDTENMFVYMPNNFKAVHDRAAEEYKALQDRKAAAEKRRKEAAAKKAMEEARKALGEILRQNEGMDAFSIKGKGLVLVVPKDWDEIRKEGEALHHCVGTYVDKVAKGETMILFVRRMDEPDTPYFTLEYKGGRVAQCRGIHNCGMPKDVEAFVAAFERRMQETAKGIAGKGRKVG